MHTTFKVFSYMLALATLAIAAPADFPIATRDEHDRTLHWAGLGDSWASGVTYQNNPSLDWDGDPGAVESCKRIVDAYAAQMSNDTSWVNGMKQDFKFISCSGSRIDTLRGQAEQMDNTPTFATLTIGGNDVGFYDIAIACIYHTNPVHFYGPDYPDQSGDCWKAIDNTRRIISDGRQRNSISRGLGAILATDQAKADPTFHIYLTGYAHFFNTDDPYCNDQSFGIFPWSKPKLSGGPDGVRMAINQLTDDLNNLYRDVVNQDYPVLATYVDITRGFDGHRFCETGMTDLYNDPNLWFFNLNIPSPFQANNLDPTTTVPVLDFSGGSNSSIAGYRNRGEFLRPFHPTRPGHGSIKQSILTYVKPTIPPK